MEFESPQVVADALRSVGYLPNDRIAQVVFLAARLDKPILVEGPAGVGKTELAKSLARVTERSEVVDFRMKAKEVEPSITTR